MKTYLKKYIGIQLIVLLLGLSFLQAYADSDNRNKNSEKQKGYEKNDSYQEMENEDEDDDEDNEEDDDEDKGKKKNKRLKRSDEDKINRIIDNFDPAKKIMYLQRVLSRIQTLNRNISNSHMIQTRKTAYLELLEEIRALVQAKLYEITGNNPEEDTEAPVFSSVSISSTLTSATLNLTSDEDGTLYYVVLLSSEGTPSVEQVMNGENSSGVTVDNSDTVSLADGVNSFDITGLSEETSYTIYYVAKDLNDNISNNVESITFTTSEVDNEAPVFSSISISDITGIGANLNLTSNKDGTLYYVVLLSSGGTPSVNQVKSGLTPSGLSANHSGEESISNTGNTINISSLNPMTSYTIHFVGEDLSGNIQNNVTSITFSTNNQDVVAPVITSYYISGITSSGVTLNYNTTESGSLYYVALLSSESAPNSTQVKEGKDSMGNIATLSGTYVSSEGSNSHNIEGLSSNTMYTLYFVEEDDSGNIMNTPKNITFLTSN